MRVLQLIDVDADLQSARLADALQPFAAARRSVRGYGIGTLRDVKPAVREAELVHVFSWRALVVGILGGGKRFVFSPSTALRASRTNWLRAAMGYRDISVVVPTATMHRQLVEQGIDEKRCRLIRPGVDFSRMQRRRNLELRRELGLSDEDFVIMAAGESTAGTNHELAIWSAAILRHLDPQVRLLFWRGKRIAKMQEFARRLRQSEMVVTAQNVEYEQALAAADLVLVTAQGSVPTLPILIAMATGVPIVSTVTSEIGELLEDRHNSLLVTKPSPKLIARRILDAREDSELQLAIADKARAESYELFAMSKCVEAWREVYSGNR